MPITHRCATPVSQVVAPTEPRPDSTTAQIRTAAQLSSGESECDRISELGVSMRLLRERRLEPAAAFARPRAVATTARGVPEIPAIRADTKRASRSSTTGARIFAAASACWRRSAASFPNAEVFTLFDFLPDDVKEQYFRDVEFHTSAANRLPMVERYYRSLFFLCPFLIEQFDVTGYDIVISSSAAFARGVLTRPDQPHLSYVHSPVRYAWDEQFSYLEQGRMGFGPKGLCSAICCTGCAHGTRAPPTVPT